jgi:hypothetical protein
VNGATAVLGAWKNGHVYVGSSGGGELYINTGNSSKSQCERLCEAVLASQRNLLSTESLQGVAMWSPDGGGSWSFHGPPEILSTYDGRRVVGYDATIDGDKVTITPALSDPVRDQYEALQRRIERASSDTVSQWGTPHQDTQDGGSTEGAGPPDWSVDGKLSALYVRDEDGHYPDRDSPLHRFKAPWKGSYLDCTLHTPGKSTTRVEMMRLTETDEAVGLTVISTCYIGAKKRRGIARIGGKSFVAGQAVLMRVSAVGTGAEKLTVAVHGASF